MPTTRKNLASLLFLLVVGVYLSSLFNAFVWDDEQFIQKNRFTTSLAYLPQIFTTNTIAGAGQVSNYYRPLTTLSFTIDRLIWGLHPFGFHLTNTLLHAGATVLVFALLLQLKMGKRVACVIALVFGVHPIQTEAVVYMNSRGDPLYAFLLLGACVAALWSFQKTKNVHLGSHILTLSSQRMLTLSLLLFSASILAKEIALAGLACIPLTMVLYLLHSKQSLDVKKYTSQGTLVLGCAGIAGIYIALRLTVLNFADTLNFYGGENLYTQSVLVRLLTFSKVIWIYLGLLVFPYPLHMERDVALVTSLLNPWTVATLGGAMGVALIGWVEWRRCHTLWICYGALWSAIFLGPVSGVVPINGILYEHWLYLPLIGVCIMGYGVWNILQSIRHIHVSARFFQICAVSIGSIFAFLTVRQNFIWRSPIPFYEYTLRYADSARLHNNLAMAYSDAGRQEAAIAQYLKAIELSDMYPQTHYNLARSYIEMGKLSEAQSHLETAIRMAPKFDIAYPLLVSLLVDQKQYEAAYPYSQTLVSAYPNDVSGLLLHGTILFHLHKLSEATGVWNQAVRISSNNPQVVGYIRTQQSSQRY